MSEIKHEPYETTPENAERIHLWLTTRGGIAHWGSVDLSDPGRSWTTPLLNADGTPKEKPHYAATSEPTSITTEVADVTVIVPVEVNRFRVAIRRGDNGFKLKLTDASSAKVRKAEEKARETAADGVAWHEFDYGTQEAVIYVNGKKQPLADFLRDKAKQALPEESAS